MSISTKTDGNAGMSKKEKIAQLQEKHTETFESLGIVEPLYIPKVVFGTPLSVPFFHSELKHEKDIYTEKVSKAYESEDPTRTLYKWTFNSAWREGRYPTKPFGAGGPTDVMYMIPFADFEKIEVKPKEMDFGLMNPDEDAALPDATLRDLAAILLEVPVSRKAWLNKIINTKNGNN
jgi:hypothetical protein